MVSPPSSVGAVHDSDSELWRGDAVSPVGAFGACSSGVPVAVADHAPSPTEFVARTRSVYAVSFVSPVMRLPVVPVPLNVVWRLVLSQSSEPDFHCTL